MGKYLRIRNRGECPRILLRLVGATTKRERMSDGKVGGWYGSDTKFCPIAALRLGIEVHVFSTDEEGPYGLTYGTEPVKYGGKAHEQVVMRFTDGTRVDTQFTTDACLNWTNPVGDDPMRSYLVLRGYLRNAADEDPDGWSCGIVDAVAPAPAGETHVFLSLSQDLVEMLKAPSRYFKWVAERSGLRPIETFHMVAKRPDGTSTRSPLGRVCPKSDANRTRMFSQGSLAFCSEMAEHRSLYDYDLERKELASEERGHFKNVSDAFMEVSRMLSAWNDPARVAFLARAIEAGIAGLEESALGLVGHLPKQGPPARETWLAAWNAIYGEKAAIATADYEDGLVKTAGYVTVRLRSKNLREYFRRCGVPDTKELAPKLVGPEAEQREVPEAELREWEREKFLRAREAFLADFPETSAYVWRFFVPLVERTKPVRGFVDFREDGAHEAWLQRGCLRSMDTLMEVMEHEIRHARTLARDDDRRFVNRADKDLRDLRMERHGLGHEPEVDVASLPMPYEPEDIPEGEDIDLTLEIDMREIIDALDRDGGTPEKT